MSSLLIKPKMNNLEKKKLGSENTVFINIDVLEGPGNFGELDKSGEIPVLVQFGIYENNFYIR